MDYEAAVIIIFNELMHNMFSVHKNISKVIESVNQEIETMKKNQMEIIE